MNAGLPDEHVSIRFYDSDYPGEISTIPSNRDATMVYQGIAYDADRYRQLAAGVDGPILELCCGTGRIAVPLARAGHDVTAVDISAAMLARFRQHLARESSDTAGRITLIQQDITALDLPSSDYPLAIIPFNSLLLITDFQSQCRALERAALHLRPRGRVAIDIVNPLRLPVEGDVQPKPFFTRRSEANGRQYTRFAALGPFNDQQQQRLHGWYDEVDDQQVVRRYPYEVVWRPIFRFELELMLRSAGLEVVSVEGGHRGEPFTAQSPRMFVIAERRPWDG